MTLKVGLTLGQIAEIALAGPKLQSINKTLLLQLVKLILNKLNCQNERVEVHGPDVQSVRDALPKTKSSKLCFVSEKSETVAELLQRIDCLDNNVAKLNERFQNYISEFENVTQPLQIPDEYPTACYEKLAEPCEDLFTSCEPENFIACKVVQNKTFIKKITRFIGYPLADRICNSERKIGNIYDELKHLNEKIDAQVKKLSIIVDICKQVEDIYKKLDNDNVAFVETMEDLQDILDAKVDKIYMPVLKKYIKNKFDDTEKRIANLETERTCPRAGGVVIDHLTCLSCGNRPVSMQRNALDAFPKFPGDILTEKPKKEKPCMCCNKLSHILETERKKYLRPHVLDLSPPPPPPSHSSLLSNMRR